MPIDVLSIQLSLGTALFVCVLIIPTASLRMLSNPAAPYWNLFSVAIFGLWISLVFFNSTDLNQLSKIVSSAFAVLSITALWLGMRTENSRKTSIAWIPVNVLVSAAFPALGYLNPIFTVPIGSLAIILAFSILVIRECLTGDAKADFFARTLAWSLGLMMIASVSVILAGWNASWNAGSGILARGIVVPSNLQLTIEFAVRFGLTAALVLAVTVISARPIRKRSFDSRDDGLSAQIGVTLSRNPAVILNRARQMETGLVVIVIEIENAQDMLTAYGPVGLEAAQNAVNVAVQRHISPMALLERSEKGVLLVMTESECVDSSSALVESLRQHIEQVSPLFNGHHFSAALSFADTRTDGYEWNELVHTATVRLVASRRATIGMDVV